MRNKLTKLLIEKLLKDDSVADNRLNPIDRRRLQTFILKDRRSGIADRRAKIPELIKRFQFGYKYDRRLVDSDRRKLNTYLFKDRRSGIADRRAGF
jgi:hypothetical protein